MSATAFLRQRRAVAAKYIEQALAGGGEKFSDEQKKAVEKLFRDRHITTEEAATNLHANNDVLSIADEIAKIVTGEPDLDSLEERNAIELGERAAVHAAEVRSDQFEDQLQHPAAETVAVGNMHDGPQAAEAIGNVAQVEVQAADGKLADAIQARAEGHPELTPEAGLPVDAPAPGGAASEPTGDRPVEGATAAPEGAPAAVTVSDLAGAAEAAAEQQRSHEQLAADVANLDGFDDMDPAQLREEAAKRGFTLPGGNTGAPKLRDSLRQQIQDAHAMSSEVKHDTDGHAVEEA